MGQLFLIFMIYGEEEAIVAPVVCPQLLHLKGLLVLLSVKFKYKPGYKPCDLLKIQFLSLVEITAFRLESKSCKGFFVTNKFSTNESTRIYNRSCDL